MKCLCHSYICISFLLSRLHCINSNLIHNSLRLFDDKEVNAKTKVWAQGMEGWRLLQQVAQLKWSLLAKGQAVMNESEMAALILDILISVCR